MVYTEPIEINENMIIIATAYRQDMDYSDTLGLYFTILDKPDLLISISNERFGGAGIIRDIKIEGMSENQIRR